MSDLCIQVKKVYVHVPLETVYRGATASQPRAYLKGRGIVYVKDHIARITAS